jgi:hypothetical protein
VTFETQAAVRELAAADGVTMDEEIRLLARAERQRRMGLALAAPHLDSDEEAWLELGARAVSGDEGG